MKRALASRKFQAGQAAIETAIASAFLLIPLLLIVFLIGKYAAMKSATVQAARYTAFERTVYAPFCLAIDPTCTETVRGIEASVRGNQDISNAASMRIFSGGLSESIVTDLQHSLLVGGLGYTNNTLYTDQAGNALLPGDATGPDVILTMQDGLSPAAVDAALALTQGPVDLLSLGLAGLNLSYDAFYTSTVTTTPAKPIGPSEFAALNLSFTATASILTDTWSASSETYSGEQISGLVPTSLLSPVNLAIDVASGALPIPEVGFGIGVLPDLAGLAELGPVTTADPVEVPEDRLAP